MAQLSNAKKAVIASMIALLSTGKSDEEIIEASITEKIGNQECTPELLAELLELAKADLIANVSPKKTNAAMFGNKDEEKKHEFPSTWDKHVVVRESVEQKIGPKETDVAEVPSSVFVKPYDATLFDTHVKQGMFNKKKVVILHDPRN